VRAATAGANHAEVTRAKIHTTKHNMTAHLDNACCVENERSSAPKMIDASAAACFMMPAKQALIKIGEAVLEAS
jgi:hypothetical protein